MAPDEDASRKTRADSIAPRDYAAFIDQVELTTIWLATASVKNQYGPETPEKGVLDIQRSARWEPYARGFRAFHTYNVTMQSADTALATMAVTFGLDFDSTLPMTDAIFEVFQVVNLPVNTWPYLREFLATTVGRFGWEAVTIPAFKVGAKPSSNPRQPHQAPARPRRRPRET